GTAATRVLLNKLRVPLIFIAVGDPVGSGFVEKMNRRGGRATGVTNATPLLAEKRAQVVRELVAQGGTGAVVGGREGVAVLFPSSSPGPLGRSGFVVQRTPVEGWEEIEQAVLAMRQQRPDMLSVTITGTLNKFLDRLFRLVAAEKIPTICDINLSVEQGCLA